MANITPSKTRNGRRIIRDEYKVFCGQPINSGEEFNSSGLAAYIPNLVKSCDENGTPALLVIKFYLAPNKKLMTIEVPILPTVVENHKLDTDSRMLYTFCEDEVDTLYKTKMERAKNPKAFRESANDNASKIILYIQRELCIRYLKLKSKPQKTADDIAAIKAIENLSIVKYLGLSDIKKSDIDSKKIRGLDYREQDSRQSDYDATFEYSSDFQATHSDTHHVELVIVGENTSVIGLQKGNSPEEIALYAEIDALANQVKFDKDVFDKRIIYDYITNKKRKTPKKPETPGTPTGPANE